MASAVETLNIDWKCRHTWQVASYNTMWCLIGCSIGDIGTIAFFDFYNVAWPVMAIMALAIFNGLLTSIILETIILCKQMAFNLALRTALGMSLISMIAMELAMNLTDIAITGGAKNNFDCLTHYASSRLSYTFTLQLLAAKSPRKSLSLSKITNLALKILTIERI